MRTILLSLLLLNVDAIASSEPIGTAVDVKAKMLVDVANYF